MLYSPRINLFVLRYDCEEMHRSIIKITDTKATAIVIFFRLLLLSMSIPILILTRINRIAIATDAMTFVNLCSLENKVE
jgi:hypothetical protein